jgi:hypothetical protein
MMEGGGSAERHKHAHSYVLTRSQKHIFTPIQEEEKYVKENRMWSNND